MCWTFANASVEFRNQNVKQTSAQDTKKCCFCWPSVTVKYKRWMNTISNYNPQYFPSVQIDVAPNSADVSLGETADSWTQLRLNFGPAGTNVVKKGRRTGGNEWKRRGPIRLWRGRVCGHLMDVQDLNMSYVVKGFRKCTHEFDFPSSRKEVLSFLLLQFFFLVFWPLADLPIKLYTLPSSLFFHDFLLWNSFTLLSASLQL